MRTQYPPALRLAGLLTEKTEYETLSCSVAALGERQAGQFGGGQWAWASLLTMPNRLGGAGWGIRPGKRRTCWRDRDTEAALRGSRDNLRVRVRPGVNKATPYCVTPAPPQPSTGASRPPWAGRGLRGLIPALLGDTRARCTALRRRPSHRRRADESPPLPIGPGDGALQSAFSRRVAN